MAPASSTPRLRILLTFFFPVLVLTACEDRPSSSSSVEPVESTSPGEEEPTDESYVALIEAAIETAVDLVSHEREDDGRPPFSRVVLDLPVTLEGFRSADGDGPTGEHVRDAFAAHAAEAEATEWREGARSAEITCEPVDGYPRTSCTMDEGTLVLIIRPRGEQGGRLENGNYGLGVWIQYQVLPAARNGARVVAFGGYHMNFRLADGEWTLVRYGTSAA